MASSGSGYDLSTSTFSPDGRIFQVEYAGKAVENANTVIGIHASDGIVLAASKPILHKMVVPFTGSYKRIHTVAPHVGLASTGFTPDARVAVTRATDEAAYFHEMYDTSIPPPVLADRLGSYMHYFTMHGSLRAFGAACIVAGYDSDTSTPSLHLVEPNGAAFQYYGVAAGKGKQAAKTELELLQLHSNPCDCMEAVRQATRILLLLHQENKDTAGKPLELELSWLCAGSDWKHVGVPKDVLAEARTWATEQLAEEDDDDEEDAEMEE